MIREPSDTEATSANILQRELLELGCQYGSSVRDRSRHPVPMLKKHRRSKGLRRSERGGRGAPEDEMAGGDGVGDLIYGKNRVGRWKSGSIWEEDGGGGKS